MKHVSVCTFKTSPCVPAPRAHMLKHVCAWCRYTRGRFERTHGDVLSGHGVSNLVTNDTPHRTHTQHTTTQHNTTTTPHGDRERQRETKTDRDRQGERRQGQREKRRRKRRDKTTDEKREDSFSEWWCMAVFCWCSDFLVNSVCARFLSLLFSVKCDSF